MDRISLVFATVMLVVYFGFVYCFAFVNGVIGVQITPGLTIGLVAGPAVIVVGLCLSFAYVLIANRSDGGGD